MPKRTKSLSTAGELRRRAEDRLKEQHSASGQARSEADTLRLVHELQVHQIELELQNEELEQAREKLERAVEKFSDLYDFAPVGYLTLDRDGTVLEANLASGTLLGIERSRFVRRRFASHLSPSDRPAFDGFLAEVFGGHGKSSCEGTVVREGMPPLRVRLEATLAPSKSECRTVLEDITLHERAEEDRLILNKLESTGILAGGLAHDFNNLLAVIVLNLDLAQALSAPGHELEPYIREAKETALLARGLSQQLITFSKGGAPIRQLASLIPVIQESVRLALSGSAMRCDLSLAEDLWLAEVDPGQIGQVMRNLILNAKDAMADEGVISVRAENRVLDSPAAPTLPSGDYIRISVADTGSGIGKETLQNIFDPYFSTKERGTQKGMGLGLTICHSVIQKHGGAIAVESELGFGTTVHVYLPAVRQPLATTVPV